MDDARPVGLRRARDRRRPGDVAPRSRRSWQRGSRPAGEGGRQPRDRRLRAGGQDDRRSRRDGLAGRASRRRAGRSLRPDRSRRDQPGERPRGPRRAHRDRSDGGVDRRRARASARSRTPTTLGPIVDGSSPSQPEGRRRLPSGQADDRLPRRPGHEGDRRAGQRGPRPGRGPRRGSTPPRRRGRAR